MRVGVLCIAMSQSRVKALSSRVRVNAPANSFRGGWVDTFRSTVLTQLLANINQQGSSAGWTYIDYAAGPDKWDISQSVRRQWGINPVFDYGRAMSVLRHKDERVFMGHPFLGLMRRVREVNSDVVHNNRTLGDKTTVSKLVPGFKYFPSTAALLKPIMREQDRAILCEKDPEYFHVSTQRREGQATNRGFCCGKQGWAGAAQCRGVVRTSLGWRHCAHSLAC